MGRNPLTKQCEHIRNVCTSCVAQITDVAVAKRRWDNLRCPDPQCNMGLAYEDVRQVCSQSTFDRYEIEIHEESIKAQASPVIKDE